MKSCKATFLLSLLSSLLLCPPPATAQTFDCTQDMVFGTLTISCAGAGSVTVRPDGTRAVSGCFNTTPDAFAPAQCTISQSIMPYETIQVSVSGSYSLTSGGDTMTLDAFNLVTNANGPTYMTAAVASVGIPIGATLSHDTNPQTGNYSGNFTLTAIFQ